MNSKSVLNKILTLLSLEEVNLTDAKDAEGQILQSPTFDLDESVEVIHEDGTKTPAPDGEHEVELTDSEGNKVVIRIETKDGKIVSRENVEEKAPADLEDTKPKEEVVDKEADKKKEEDVKMADATTEEAHPLPNTTDEDPRNMIADDSEDTEKDPLISLSYRIAEMEKQMKTMMEKFGMDNPPMEEGADEAVAPSANLPEDGVAMAAEEEEDLPKLDGAPIESAGFKFNSDTIHKTNNSGKVPNSQNSFLSKLYS
jgi:hypothetical protein